MNNDAFKLDDYIRRLAREEAERVFTELQQEDLKTNSNDDEGLKVKEVAKILALSEWQIYELIRRGELLSYQIGKRGIRVRRGSVRAFQQNKTQPH